MSIGLLGYFFRRKKRTFGLLTFLAGSGTVLKMALGPERSNFVKKKIFKCQKSYFYFGTFDLLTFEKKCDFGRQA